jgi:hypothetical protein
MKVILISGYKRSGKDFSADILKEKLQKYAKTEKIAFADPIKDILSETLRLPRSEFDTMKNNFYWMEYGEHTLGFRDLIQRFGNDVMTKHFAAEVWTNLTINKINDLKDQGYEYVIVSDFRFEIEITELEKRFKCITLRIDDTNLGNDDSHPSEKEIEDYPFDYRIDNTHKNSGVLKEYIDSFIKEKLDLK